MGGDLVWRSGGDPVEIWGDSVEIWRRSGGDRTSRMGSKAKAERMAKSIVETCTSFDVAKSSPEG